MIPKFIPKEILRKYFSSSAMNKYMYVGKITVSGYISRCERLEKPIRHKEYNGKKYRLLDVIARAAADGLTCSPPEEFALAMDIEELKVIKSRLESDANYLKSRLPSISHSLSLNESSVRLTGKTLLTEDEIVAGKMELPATSGVYFLINANRVVYVGQSVSIGSRIRSHMPIKEFDSYAYIECEEKNLDVLESLYIHVLRPPLNGSQYHDKRVPAAPISLDKILNSYQISA
jgi:hypothetical protein